MRTRWILLLVAMSIAGCSFRAEPLNIRRDAFLGYLARSGVGTEGIVNKSLPAVRTGRKATVRATDDLGHKCTARIYVDPKHPMLLHVKTTTEQPCPECGGSGIRGQVLGGINLRCLRCEGTGKGGTSTKSKRYRVKPSDLLTGEQEEG